MVVPAASALLSYFASARTAASLSFVSNSSRHGQWLLFRLRSGTLPTRQWLHSSAVLLQKGKFFANNSFALCGLCSHGVEESDKHAIAFCADNERAGIWAKWTAEVMKYERDQDGYTKAAFADKTALDKATEQRDRATKCVPAELPTELTVSGGAVYWKLLLEPPLPLLGLAARTLVGVWKNRARKSGGVPDPWAESGVSQLLNSNFALAQDTRLWSR